jgi:2,3-bisphosphoglycerate-independent phosphoglycerate mutase
MNPVKPVALIILDGWGIREKVEGNAIALGNTPNYDRWLKERERSILDASGEAVGLPDGQMGNSEVGHLNLGAGRIVYQDLTRINLAIRDGRFNQTPALVEAMESAKQKGGNVHIVGLFGEGGVHSHSDHMYALLDMSHEFGLTPILHLITDGRDTPPESSLRFLEKLEAYQQEKPVVIASVSGRYYTMDRDKRWQRTQLGYDAIVKHVGVNGRTAPTARAAIEQSHANGVTDEFIEPVAIDTGSLNAAIKPGDSVIFYNFRADRMRQPVTALTIRDFDGFEREYIEDLFVVTMTNYDDAYPVHVAFAEQELVNVLAEVISKHGLKQFHAAETEKYAHVTYFFNGGVETPYPNEERHLQPSPKVPTYDLQPEMSAYPLTENVLKRIAEHDDDFILINFANPDMVGHTGVLEAAIKAVEAVDECAGKIVEAIHKKGGVALVTADHGNCDRMINHITGEPHTYHTTQPVSFIAIGDGYFDMRPRGILADAAPTVLHLLGIEQPKEMTGRSLIMDWRA